MTLKQKLAEKERLAAEKRASGDADELIDERTEQDRRREARERELAADLAVASDLMGGMEVSTGECAEPPELRSGEVGRWPGRAACLNVPRRRGGWAEREEMWRSVCLRPALGGLKSQAGGERIGMVHLVT